LGCDCKLSLPRGKPHTAKRNELKRENWGKPHTAKRNELKRENWGKPRIVKKRKEIKEKETFISMYSIVS
jgi:hypothetical protein